MDRLTGVLAAIEELLLVDQMHDHLRLHGRNWRQRVSHNADVGAAAIRSAREQVKQTALDYICSFKDPINVPRRERKLFRAVCRLVQTEPDQLPLFEWPYFEEKEAAASRIIKEQNWLAEHDNEYRVKFINAMCALEVSIRFGAVASGVASENHISFWS